MFSEIIAKENIKFKELEKEIFICMNMLGCSIIKEILEKQEEKIFNEGWKEGDKRHSLVNKTYIAGIIEAVVILE